MSLSSMLEETGSPLRACWNREMPKINTFSKAGLWRSALAAEPSPSARLAPGPGLVGTAVDYRVRWLWPHRQAYCLVGIRHGAQELLADGRADSLADEIDSLPVPSRRPPGAFHEVRPRR